MKKRWAPRPAPFLHLKQADNPFDLPESVNLLLARRGYTGEGLEKFLNPSMDRLSPWKSLGGSEGAADRIAAGIKSGERILVHGDFDADGITATAIVHSALSSLGGDVDYFVPDRFQDGYGLGRSGIKACEERGVQLLISVDCGVTAVEQVKRLKDLGIDVVVTDHHQPGAELPSADHIVNPSLDGDVPWSRLAGAGVAWTVMRGVFDVLRGDDDYLQKLLQLVAVGTVSDVVSLRDDNRILVSLGLEEMRDRPLPGIAALADSASRDIRRLASEDLAYYMGPRLNACGRISHARDAIALLLAQDFQTAKGLMGVVERYNRKRRKLDRQVLSNALVSAEDYSDAGCLVLAGEGWHRGVIGIAASRLVSRFGVPSVMVALEEGTGYGSARSVPGIPIYSILSDIQRRRSIMDSLGGHPMAAGFSMPKDKVPDLREELETVMESDEMKKHLGSVLYVDGRLEPEDYRLETVRALKMMEPFGEGNRKPVWLARGAYPLRWKVVGKDGKHLSCTFRTGGGEYRAIGFNMSESQSLFGGRVDLAFTLAEDTYRNDGSVQLVLKGIRRERRASR